VSGRICPQAMILSCNLLNLPPVAHDVHAFCHARQWGPSPRLCVTKHLAGDSIHMAGSPTSPLPGASTTLAAAAMVIAPVIRIITRKKVPRTQPHLTAVKGRLSRVARGGSAVTNAPPALRTAEVERRLNPWDGRVYTLEELRKWAEKVNWSEEELQTHWHDQCRPLEVARQRPKQVAEWQRAWQMGPLQRTWSKADFGHIHAITGILYMLLGTAYLVDTVFHDMAVLSGSSADAHMSIEVASAILVLGGLNAISSLQPALIAKTPGSLVTQLGFGENGNLKTGGFVNTCLFYFILLYQALRVLPSCPSAAALMDPVVGIFSILGMVHATFILNSWVNQGLLNRVGADLVFSPPWMNLPVALHLASQGQSWIEQLSNRYPGWPEAFFCSNFALAWGVSMATFVLTLYERKVISVEVRNFLIIVLPLMAFATIPLRVAVLTPEWFSSDWITIFTLSPPLPPVH